MRKSTLVIVASAIIVNIALWTSLNQPAAPEPSWPGLISGVSFSPYQKDQDPFKKVYPTIHEIDRDLRVLKGTVINVRTYSSADGQEHVPRLAQSHRMNVTAGAWLSKDLAKNELEIANLIRNVNTHSNIKRAIVGNEVLLRGEMTVKELGEYLNSVRYRAVCPVSTAEPWHVWVKYPELAEYVDFIAIHVLPYWEKVPYDQSVDWVLQRYQQIQRLFPNKPVLIAEVGWPSNGARRGKAKPSLINESAFLRRFLNLAADRDLDYFIMEAFDQPWKEPTEGIVGAHWGIFDANRKNKLILEGPIVHKSLLNTQIVLSTLLGLIPLIVYLRRRPDQPFKGRLFYAVNIQLTMSFLTWILSVPISREFLPSETLIWGILLPMQVVLLLIILINAFEMSEILFPQGLKRRFFPRIPEPDRVFPKVSIHVAICNEPPEMVARTLDSLAMLDYPDYEVLVIDNNTLDTSLWEPVRDHCEKLGGSFRFFNLGKWPGFKAGALNYAIRVMDPAARIIGVVDSDYIVRPDWLKSLVPHFDRPEVGFVQAPQDHREWEGNVFKEMCNWEYNGFFQIGMVHRNERDAIIQHGTMTLIRKSALEAVNRWGEWCICEDAELGLRLLNGGYESVYVNEIFGQGLTPDSFAGYKKQRFRWAYGAVQIIKRHWRLLFCKTPDARLTFGQRYHFATGWLPWFGDALSVIITYISILWSAGMIFLPRYFGQPFYIFLVPSIAVFGFKLVHFLWLYKARVGCGLLNRIGAAIAGLSLTHTIGKAILISLFTKDQPFLRTPKCENRHAVVKGVLMAWEEILFFMLLLAAARGIVLSYGTDNPEIMLWIYVLLIQSFPYAAALICSTASILPMLAFRGIRRPVMVHGRNLQLGTVVVNPFGKKN